MKYLMVLILFLQLAPTAVADDSENHPNQVTVIGTAKVKAPADRAQLYFSVIGYGSSLRQAVEKAREKSAKISRELLGIGLQEKNLQTSRFYSGENYGGKAFLSSKKDYQASIAVLVTVEDLDLLEQTIFVLSENDLETLSDIAFSLADEDTYRSKAREMAITKAREKALQMTGLLNASLGNVLSIEENYLPGPEQQPLIRGGRANPINASVYFTEQDGMFASGGMTGFFGGTITVSAQVSVVFAINQ